MSRWYFLSTCKISYHQMRFLITRWDAQLTAAYLPCQLPGSIWDGRAGRLTQPWPSPMVILATHVLHLLLLQLLTQPWPSHVVFVAGQNSWIGDLVTHWLPDSPYFYFWHTKRPVTWVGGPMFLTQGNFSFTVRLAFEFPIYLGSAIEFPLRVTHWFFSRAFGTLAVEGAC